MESEWSAKGLGVHKKASSQTQRPATLQIDHKTVTC
jgi:hypothetical protein